MELRSLCLVGAAMVALNAVPADAQRVSCPEPVRLTAQARSSIQRVRPRLRQIARSTQALPRKAAAVDSLLPGIDDVRVFEYMFCEAYRAGSITREQYDALVRQILPVVPGVRQYSMTGRSEAASAYLNRALGDIRAHAGSAARSAELVARNLSRQRPNPINHVDDSGANSLALQSLGDNLRRLCWQAGPTMPQQVRAILFPVAALSSTAREFAADTVFNPGIARQLQDQTRGLGQMIDSLDRSTRRQVRDSVSPGPAPLSACNREWSRITVRQD